ncbi:hypothetical protein N1851_024487 [Merluccius polli]|uniref:Uncharacterized protein n=1 Tax=Merluccius polli TaxID=89951 RepID=A0AA47MEV6_MERPO|nr:hypothetical protein N1851_024487 [Merluccius polli]
MATNSFEYGRLAELEHGHSRLRKETGEMRRLLEVADEEVAELRMENAALTSKVKNLESSLSDTGQNQAELRRVTGLLADEQSSNRSKEHEIKKLKEDRKNLMEQDKVSSAQLKDLQQQKEQIELNTSNLKATLQRLQIRMEDIQHELKLKDETIHQDLRLRIKDLESQVELQQEEAARLVTHQYTQNPLSIAAEVELQASLAVVESSKQDETDDGKKTAVKDFSKSQCHSGGKTLQGSLTTGILAIGGVVVLAVLAPLVLDIWGYNADHISVNNLWKTVHDLFLHYCDIQYKCLPPV